jgi:hypothetical protein
VEFSTFSFQRSNSMFSLSTLCPIRCSVIRRSVIRCWVFLRSVIRCLVIRSSVFITFRRWIEDAASGELSRGSGVIETTVQFLLHHWIEKRQIDFNSESKMPYSPPPPTLAPSLRRRLMYFYGFVCKDDILGHRHDVFAPYYWYWRNQGNKPQILEKMQDTVGQIRTIEKPIKMKSFFKKQNIYNNSNMCGYSSFYVLKRKLI